MVEINDQEIEKINNSEGNDPQDGFYNIVRNHDDIRELYSAKEIKKLYENIDQTDISLFGQQALIGLLKDFDKDEINTENIEQEIDVLKKAHIENNTKENIDNTKENIDNTKENIDNTKENIENTKENIENTKENIENTKENIENTKENIENKFDHIKTLYQNTNEKYKPILGSPERNTFYTKEQQNSKLLDILSINNIDLNLYLQIRFAAEKYAQELQAGGGDAESTAFITQFNTLNKSLDIDYQINIPIEDTKFTNKPNTVADIIKNPESIMAYDSMREYTKAQSDMMVDKENISVNPKLQTDIMSKFSDDTRDKIIEQIQENCLHNQLLTREDFVSNPRTIDLPSLLITDKQNTIGEDEKKNIQTIIDNIVGGYTKDYLINQTNEILKKGIMQQVVSGLARYFDTTNPNLENFAQNFRLDTGDVTIENGVLHISGKMHGQIVHFFYNLNTGELQANNYLSKAINGNTFLINDIKNGKITLPNKLPTIGELQSKVTNISFDKIINDSSSLGNYQSQINKETNKLQKNFDGMPINKMYIERANEKNLFIQETLDMVGNNLGQGGTIIPLDNSEKPVTIVQDISPHEYKLLSVLDRTSHYYRSPDALRQLRGLMGRLDTSMKSERIQKGEHKDPVINILFNQPAMLQSAENWGNPHKETNFMKFFDMISYPAQQGKGGIINLQLLENIVVNIEKNQIINTESESRYFKEKYEAAKENNLASADTRLSDQFV